MDKDLEISRVGIQFGEELDQDNCSQLNISVDFSQKLTKESMDKLATSSKGEIDINKACVIELMTANPENAQELFQLIKEITNMKTEEDNIEKFGEKGALLGGSKIQLYFNYLLALLTGAVSSGTLIIKVCIHSTDSRRVMVSIKGSDKMMASFIEPLETLIESGLQNISNNTGNSIEYNIFFSKFDQILEQLIKTQNLYLSFLSKIKIEGIVRLSKFLSDSLSQVFNNIDPGFNQSPPMMFLKYFKMVDVELRFNSVEELPALVKKKLYNPFKDSTFALDKVKAPENKFFQKLETLIASHIIVHMNLIDFVTCKLNIQLPGLSHFLEVVFAAIDNDSLKKLGL